MFRGECRNTGVNQMSAIDLVIVGGGCAGLSLARELVLRGVDKNVLVIEPRTTYEDDRSWCFWAPSRPGSADSILSLVHRRWSCWRFGQAGQPQRARQADGLSYQYLRSIDFYRACCETIEPSPWVQLQLGVRVQSVMPVAAGWQVTTDHETIVTREVIDTRPPEPSRAANATLQQVFLGWEIGLPAGSAASEAIDLDSVELMSDMRVVDGEFCFTYILPISATRLLVEVTFFAGTKLEQPVLEETLSELLDRRGWQNATVIRREYAVLPMGLPVLEHKPGRPTSAGMGGGALRSSSGYGFLRIQRWAQGCAAPYVATGEVIGHAKPSFWWRWMDQLFLDVIEASPRLAPGLFDRMLGRTEPVRFVRFMNDEATWRDCLSVIRSLPKRPFVEALARRLSTGLGGKP